MAWVCFRIKKYKNDLWESSQIVNIMRIGNHSSLELLNIQRLFDINCLKFVYRFKQHSLPSYFLSFYCIPRSDIHEHDTRYAHITNVEGTRTKMAENCIRHHLTIILNNTSGCILDEINTHNLQGFSFFIKRYYLNELTYECHLRECYVCRKWTYYDYRKAALGWW